jgi:DNA-directed RNA polymerase alpha subunit
MLYFSKKVKRDGNKLSFLAHDIDVSIANAIRRIGLSELPTVALDYDPTGASGNEHVMINKNTCALHNEFLMHRISLVPFHFTEEEIAEYEPGRYIFKLVKDNKSTAIVNVTTRDITIHDADGKAYASAFVQRVLPSNSATGDHILLTKLKPGEEVDLQFTLRKGVGAEHARWCPVSQFSYSFVEKEPIKHLSVLDAERSYDKNKWGEPTTILITVESECAIGPESIIQRSFEILINKVSELRNAVKKREESKCIVKAWNVNNMYDVKMINEGHTLGNVLQSMMYNFAIRKDGANGSLSYIGYHKPHPLEPMIVLKCRLNESTVDIYDVLDDLLLDVQKHIESILESWNQ